MKEQLTKLIDEHSFIKLMDCLHFDMGYSEDDFLEWVGKDETLNFVLGEMSESDILSKISDDSINDAAIDNGLINPEDEDEILNNIPTGYCLIKVDTMTQREALRTFCETQLFTAYNEQATNILF